MIDLKPELLQGLKTIDQVSRRDPVADLCRGLLLRIECCPCLQAPPCRMCKSDCRRIEAAYAQPVLSVGDFEVM